MSAAKEEAYMLAGGSLREALWAYIQAAEDVGISAQEIADDVGDALCDASDRSIILGSTTIQ